MNLTDGRDNRLPTFRNPPILNGLESKLSQINKKDNLRKTEKIKNNIINRDEDDKFFSNYNMKNVAKAAIRAPPNFLY
jgi:hypothetical protein